jgi:hypothetical protein
MPDEWDDPERADEEEEEIGPGDPDYDLSEAHGYTWEPAREHWPVPPWLLVTVSLLVVVALVLPGVIFLLRHS